jgi:hypothetical protein
MANRERGEATVELGGRQFTARMSLDALARIEDAFGVEDFGEAFAKVFGGSGVVSARDLMRFLSCVLVASGAAEADVKSAMAATTPEEGLAAAIAIMEVGGFKRDDSQPAPAGGASPLGGKRAGSSGAA